MNASALPTHGFPLKDDSINGAQLPLIILADLDDSERTRLIHHLRGSVKDGEPLIVHIWGPSIETLQSIAKQGPFPDSQANIHAIAVLASRAGWDGLLVADQLTKRQLNGSLRVGEYPTVSAVMVSIRTCTEGRIRILAKRTAGPTWPIGGDEHELVYEDILTEMSTFEPTAPIRGDNPFPDAGLVLYDPDRRPFSPETSGTLEWEKQCGADVSRIELPKGTIQHGRDHFNVVLLFPTTEDEQKTTESALQQAMDVCLQLNQSEDGEDGESSSPLQVHVVPWDCHKAVSRRQIIELWDACQRCLPLNKIQWEVFLLKEPIQDVANVELGVVRERYGGYKFAQAPLRHIVSRRSYTEPEVVAPNHPFYVTTPDWQSTSYALTWIPVFYLTNKLTPEQDRAVRGEIVRLVDVDVADSKCACYVPWTKDESCEGNLDDMWEIFWDVYTYKRGHAVPCGHNTPVFFIDRQSGIDQTVIVAEADTLYIPRDQKTTASELLDGIDVPQLRGFRHNRIPAAEAHGAFVNLGIANMGFDEFGDEAQVKKYSRPGWPGHGILKDEDEDDDSDE
ncbi:hypothetical protein ASPVEDRAFT_363583 [Aspergillus versicolor CBS 583.65]|uniref:Uncharacterized protein n=1 Tax=Aspergillus versicolor CBS 583.65 TaxID=1036611 RepID=A0A1L9Q0J2_ASPVE|nr:uncharacterized protein ASPVEDRAFT_363583 [Aspergillus versicolor CBS 583.65]OJJ07291.1 hypothetical protein ASPVEDRAFT_363583 [Aspergillus versicolor CBS 583.65]